MTAGDASYWDEINDAYKFQHLQRKQVTRSAWKAADPAIDTALQCGQMSATLMSPQSTKNTCSDSGYLMTDADEAHA